MGVIDRMSRHTPESFPLMIQPTARRTGGGEMDNGQLAQQETNRRKQAEYLASLNLSSVEQWPYPLQTSSRRAAKPRKY